MNEPFVHIDTLRQFTADGQVYRAFDHLVAARLGTLLLIPPRLVVGNLDAVVDCCPVPHEEVYAVLEYRQNERLQNKTWNGLSTWTDEIAQLEYIGIDPASCAMDYITPMVKGEDKVLRLVHQSGVR